MEAVEFFVIDGKTCICRNGVSEPLKPSDRDAVSFMYEQISKYFPQAFDRLKAIAEKSKYDRRYYEYRIVDRFVRCNFGDADFLHPDVEMNMFHFEEVKCPLRGICKDEGVICKPKINLGLSEEERKVVSLYAKGLLPNEIAEKLGKAEMTCKHQISSACKRLKLPGPRWLIRLFSVYEII